MEGFITAFVFLGIFGSTLIFAKHIMLYNQVILALMQRGQQVSEYEVGFINYGSVGARGLAKDLLEAHSGTLLDEETKKIEVSIKLYKYQFFCFIPFFSLLALKMFGE